MSVVIYHNPRCSKSRQTLALLRERGIEPEIVRYLDEPPGVKTLQGIAAKLSLSPREMMRVKEAAYKELNLKAVDEAAALFTAMADNPVLIERPIVVNGERAAIGRPPEAVLEIL